MTKIVNLLGVAILLTVAVPVSTRAADWPQFRGPNGSGRPAHDPPLPAELGPDTNVLWKTALPPGHSSPVVVGDRVYLTAVRQPRLVTLAPPSIRRTGSAFHTSPSVQPPS